MSERARGLELDAESGDWIETAQDGRDGTGTWEWDIYYTTHELLSQRVHQAARSRVLVLADTWHTSWKRACEMISYRAGWYITRTDCVSWPDPREAH